MKKKLSLKRILILSLAFVMSLSVLVFGGCSLFNNEAETEPKADGNLVVSEITKSPLIAFSAPELSTNGVTTITATVSPSTGVDSRLNWTMSWGVEHSIYDLVDKLKELGDKNGSYAQSIYKETYRVLEYAGCKTPTSLSTAVI